MIMFKFRNCYISRLLCGHLCTADSTNLYIHTDSNWLGGKGFKQGDSKTS